MKYNCRSFKANSKFTAIFFSQCSWWRCPTGDNQIVTPATKATKSGEEGTCRDYKPEDGEIGKKGRDKNGSGTGTGMRINYAKHF